MIEVEQLCVRFNAGLPTEVTALNGLNLHVDEGEFVSLIGSNGAGKSTLLNAIGGDIPVSAGRIVIAGADVTTQPAHVRAGLVARVFQDPLAGTCEHLSVEENLALALDRGRRRSLRPATSRSLRERFAQALAELGLGLEHKLRDPVSLLSGGQRQVVSLLMASLAPSKLLLLDEHTSALDPRTAAFVLRMSERLADRDRLTVLMVTHSMHQALEVGSRTVMLHEGRTALDVRGAQRAGMTVTDLMDLFAARSGAAIQSDALILSR